MRRSRSAAKPACAAAWVSACAVVAERVARRALVRAEVPEPEPREDALERPRAPPPLVLRDEEERDDPLPLREDELRDDDPLALPLPLPPLRADELRDDPPPVPLPDDDPPPEEPVEPDDPPDPDDVELDSDEESDDEDFGCGMRRSLSARGGCAT